MGEAILTRRTVGTSDLIGNAIIRVETFAGASVTVTDGGANSYTKTSEGSVDFTVSYGTWYITSTYSGNQRTATVVVDTMKIYQVNCKGLTYGIQIDTSVSDPAAAVTYIDDAVGFTPLTRNPSSGACDYGSWQSIITDWLGVKPCLWSNGNRTTYLNPNNYALTTSGTTADITSGSAGDVMVEFSKKWYRFNKSGRYLTFEVSDYDRSNDGFVTTAFLSENGSAQDRDYFYYGAYEGYNLSSRLRSLSGKTITPNVSYNDWITYASNNNAACTIETLYKRCYILGLLMLVCKSRGIQAVVGSGRIASNSSAIATGTMNAQGLFYGTSDTTKGVKVFGIENFWGNMHKWMAGLVTMSTTGLLGVKKCAPYSASGSGYTSITTGFGTGGGYLTDCSSYDNGAIMLPVSCQSDGTIGWPDYFSVNAASGLVPYVGGAWDDTLGASGPFYCYVNGYPARTASSISARLVAS